MACKMLFLLLVSFLLSPACHRPGACWGIKSTVVHRARWKQQADSLTSNLNHHFQSQLPPPPATHTRAGIHDVLPVGLGEELGLTSRPGPNPSGGRKCLPTLEHRLSGLYRSRTALGIENQLVFYGGRRKKQESEANAKRQGEMESPISAP